MHDDRRVLVVDDDPELARAISRCLRGKGFQPVIAGDGLEAVSALASTRFDAIVSDINMPNMDGMRLVRAVRERDLDVPVVLMTALPSVETAADAVDLGVFRYLPKPLDLQQLASTVEQAVLMRRLTAVRREALEYLNRTGVWMGDRVGLELRFHDALKTLKMAYQPIVAWSTRQVFAYEALARPREPSLANPVALLTAADRLGLQHQLGRQIRDQVAATVAASSIPQVFVNIQPGDLEDDSLFAADAPLAQISRRVVLELTERSALHDIEALEDRVQRLRQMGFRLAVDDLGAGYAGLTSFAHLKPEVVKLDMSLVRDVDKESTKRRLVRSMRDLCADLGIAVICEGVETPEEHRALVELGCDLFQGYLFAKPGDPFPEPRFSPTS